MIVIIILSVLVILHELGHFFMAVWLKIKVEEFGLGYPPKARRLFTWLGTDFTLNWIPFGGFVRLWGEEEPLTDDQISDEQTSDSLKSTMPAKTKLTEVNLADAFYLRPLWQRLLVMLAGPLMNAFVALALFGLVFSVGGIPVSLQGKARISRVIENTPAAQVGVPLHYQIVGFAPAGTAPEKLSTVLVKADQISAVQEFVTDHRDQTWQIVLQGPCKLTECGSDQKVVELHFRSAVNTPTGQGAIGVSFSEYELQFYPWYEMPFRGVLFGVHQAISMSQTMLVELGKLVTDLVKGKGVSSAVAGPIGIIYAADQAGLNQAGWLAILNFAGMISLNLAVMNLLPIPALDGGRIFLLLLELVLGKNRVARFEGYVNYGGFVFLLGLLIIISIRDVGHIWK